MTLPLSYSRPLLHPARSLSFAREFGCGLPLSRFAGSFTPAKRLKLLPLNRFAFSVSRFPLALCSDDLPLHPYSPLLCVCLNQYSRLLAAKNAINTQTNARNFGSDRVCHASKAITA